MLLSEFTVEDAVKLARTEGWTEGRTAGRTEGITEGLERGKVQGIFETVAAFKKMGVSAEQITRATGLTPEQLAGL